ncbi:MAG TPA: gamma-glutamyltransferase [Gemmatimonadaceae bacterium]|jgi:gamma-glutamyltranspeptidase/glutathione hydrolase
MTTLRANRSRALVLGAALVTACGLQPPQSSLPPMFAKRAESARGMVTASHADAAAAGARILREGGNAVDAAVATAFALAVVDPSQTGIGAGGGMIVWMRGSARADALEFYARTGADPDWSRTDTASMRAPINGRAAGIPGAVAGLLEAHAKWGKLPRAQVMAPAIALARDGFIVSPLLARTAEASRAKLTADSAAAALFLPGGQALRPGDRLVQAQLAQTLDAIARDGRAAFYEGPMAERTAARMRSFGSPATAADFRNYPVAVERPLCTTWMGYTLLSAPPPLGGAVPLAALNLLAATNAGPLGSPTTQGAAAVQIVNALRVAGNDATRFRGDPGYFAVPSRGLISPAFAAKRVTAVTGLDGAATPTPGDPWAEDAVAPTGACATLEGWGASKLGPDKVAEPRAPRAGGDEDAAWEGSNTTHFSVVDGDRNAVSMTFTVGVLFGSGVYVNGFFLNSGASNLDNATRGPNRYASSTINPTIILKGNDVRMVVGAAGSQYIPTSTTQVTWRHLALGEDPWTAIAAPRLQPAQGRNVEVEAGFAPEVYAALKAKGYMPLSRVGDIMFGGVHAIAVVKGKLVGVADPRRDGAAMGY